MKEKGILIRIGVNVGLFEKWILEKYGYLIVDGMVESVFYYIKIFEDFDFYDIIVSMKVFDVNFVIEVYEKVVKVFDYLFYFGIIELGILFVGIVKSVVGFGVILSKGIGNILCILLSVDFVEEVKVVREFLKFFGLVFNVVMFILCLICGCIEIDLISIVNEVEEYIFKVKVLIKVVVFGCVVNGSGEVREVDIGIVGVCGEGLLFWKGKIVCKVFEEIMVEEFKKEIDIFVEEYYVKFEVEKVELKEEI